MGPCCDPSREVSHRRAREQSEGERDPPEAVGERCDVAEDVQLEDADKEGSEVVKHLDEEVPTEADGWCEIREGETARGEDSLSEDRGFPDEG